MPVARKSPSPATNCPVVVSACLAGVPCRYDGAARPDPEVVAAAARGEVVTVCAELLGGLPTPRDPSEIVGGDGADVLIGRARVITADGTDVTQQFLEGARAAADAAEKAMENAADNAVDSAVESAAERKGTRRAILQALSPACGCGTIYDGTHTGTLTSGDGVFAAELRRRGFQIEERRGERQ